MKALLIGASQMFCLARFNWLVVFIRLSNLGGLNESKQAGGKGLVFGEIITELN